VRDIRCCLLSFSLSLTYLYLSLTLSSIHDVVRLLCRHRHTLVGDSSHQKPFTGLLGRCCSLMYEILSYVNDRSIARYSHSRARHAVMASTCIWFRAVVGLSTGIFGGMRGFMILAVFFFTSSRLTKVKASVKQQIEADFKHGINLSIHLDNDASRQRCGDSICILEAERVVYSHIKTC